MSSLKTRLMMAALIAVAVPSYSSVGSATPISGALAIKNAVPERIETVRWYGGGWHGGGWGRGGWGWGFGGGLAAGAIIGGALAAPYYGGGYYGGPYGYPGPGYYAEPGDDGVEYCMQRYRSYNPNTGTFMGNDGRPHPCP